MCASPLDFASPLKIVQVVALCRVEPQLHVIRSRSPLDPPPASTTATLQAPGFLLPHSGSRLRAFNKRVYSHLPLFALSLPQPARQPQVSHCCCVHPLPLNNRLHSSCQCPAHTRVYPNPVFNGSFLRRSPTSFTHAGTPVTPTNSRPRTYAPLSATSATSPSQPVPASSQKPT